VDDGARRGRHTRRPAVRVQCQSESSVTPRTSAQRKFSRGVEQVGRLLKETEAFESRDAYVFRVEIESRSTNEIRYRALAAELEAPPDEWPLLAGEAIQNLRSALDHVVYAASGGRSGTQFPIFTEARKFQARASQILPGVPGSVVATIERAQPYQTNPNAPDRAMLEQLRVLSNLDKHRTLTTLASAVMREGVGTPEGVSITWQQYGTNRPLGSGETHVSTFTASSQAALDEGDVQPIFGYEVQIEGRAVNLLKGIVHQVYRVLVECETGKPLSPVARYPL
jgi:hypothetical protein